MRVFDNVALYCYYGECTLDREKYMQPYFAATKRRHHSFISTIQRCGAYHFPRRRQQHAWGQLGKSRVRERYRGGGERVRQPEYSTSSGGWVRMKLERWGPHYHPFLAFNFSLHFFLSFWKPVRPHPVLLKRLTFSPKELPVNWLSCTVERIVSWITICLFPFLLHRWISFVPFSVWLFRVRTLFSRSFLLFSVPQEAKLSH